MKTQIMRYGATTKDGRKFYFLLADKAKRFAAKSGGQELGLVDVSSLFAQAIGNRKALQDQ